MIRIDRTTIAIDAEHKLPQVPELPIARTVHSAGIQIIFKKLGLGLHIHFEPTGIRDSGFFLSQTPLGLCQVGFKSCLKLPY